MGYVTEKIREANAQKALDVPRWQAMLDKAHEAGHKAATDARPEPMIVQEHSSPLNDASPVVRQWRVPEGVCGFAWVSFYPERGGESRRLVNWMLKAYEEKPLEPSTVYGTRKPHARIHGQLFSHNSYAGNFELWISDYGQSLERKSAYANAFANVVRAANIEGLRAYAGSRMD